MSYGLSFPIGKKSKLILNAGGEYAFYLNGKGKQLDRESIIQNFDRSNKDLAGGRFAGRLTLSYELVLSEKIGLNLGFNGSKYFTKWGTNGTGKHQGSLLYGLQAGLKRSL